MSPRPSQFPANPAEGALPLGQFTLTSGSKTCAQGQECEADFEVTCPEVSQPAAGTLRIKAPLSGARGVLLLFAGGAGTSFIKTSHKDSFEQRLRQAGVMVIEAPWRDSWLKAAPGEQAGPVRLGCRPATVVKWVHDNVFASMGAQSLGAARCGFCIGGDSGGASQVAFPLSHYGLSDIIDVAIMASGPVHTGLAPGCLQDPGRRDLWYTRRSAPVIDNSYGFLDMNGRCAQHDPSFTDRWEADSLESTGSDYNYPNTRAVFVFGGQDRSPGPPHGELFLQALQAAGSPRIIVRSIASMGHFTANSAAAMDTVGEEVLA